MYMWKDPSRLSYTLIESSIQHLGKSLKNKITKIK